MSALADVAVHSARLHDDVETRLERFGDQRLQRPRLDRQLEPGHRGEYSRIAGCHAAHLAGADEAPRCVDAGDRAVGAANAGDLRPLQDVDPLRVGGTGESPRHRVVPGDPAAALQRSAEYRIAGSRRAVHERHQFPNLGRGEHFGIDAVQAVGVHPASDLAHVVQVVAQVEHPARTEHDVEVEFPAQTLPELERELVEARRLVAQVVGPHDGGVSTRVATAEPALLDDRDIGDAVYLGEVVGGRQPVAAPADDHGVVGLLRRGIPPRPLPVLVVVPSVTDQAEERVFLHSSGARPRIVVPHPTGI